MDPATIIGTTSAILSFVEFSGSVISTAIEIGRDALGATADNRSFQDVVNGFNDRLRELQGTKSTLAGTSGSGGKKTELLDAETSLVQARVRCEELASRVLVLLDRTTAKTAGVGAQPSRYQRILAKIPKRPSPASNAVDLGSKVAFGEVIRASVLTVWKMDEIHRLRSEWQGCMTEFNLARFRFEACGRLDLIAGSFEINLERLKDIRGLLDTLVQAGTSRSQELDSLRAFVDEFKQSNSVSHLEQRNHDWILRGLEFDGMNARRSQVERAAGSTFEWCVSDDAIPKGHPELDISFRNWLATGGGVYHITGKPGSGKSTLMKFIDNADQTEHQLQQWASSSQKKLIRASFYTWNAASASPLQNRLDGLVRTLLYQILLAAPELTGLVFAKRWTPAKFMLVNVLSHQSSVSRLPDLDTHEVMAALESIILKPDLAERFCLFLLIDGMDEFGKAHEHSNIARKVLDWTSSSAGNVKICVSSREEVAFMNTFSVRQRLRLHIVSKNDIEALVQQRLQENNYFMSNTEKNRLALIKTLVAKAEGVFLWVVLTVQELIELLDAGQNFQQLLEMVDDCPEELDECFKRTVMRIPRRHHDEARAIFSIITTFSGSDVGFLMGPFHYSMVREVLCDSEQISGYLSVGKVMETREADDQATAFISRLPSVCKGLVYLDRDDGMSFIHRSVYAFFQANRNLELFFTSPTSNIPATHLLLLSAIQAAEATDCYFDAWQEAGTGRLGILTREFVYVLIAYFASNLSHEMADIDDQVFRYLQTLEMVLLRKKYHLSSGRLFGSADFEIVVSPTHEWNTAHDDIGDFPVLTTACWYLFAPYIKWASTHYPSWIRSPKCQISVLRQMMYNDDDEGYPFYLARLLVLSVANGWMQINNVLDLGLDHPPMPILERGVTVLVAGSIWLRLLIHLLWHDGRNLGRRERRKDRDRVPCAELITLLEMGAEPRVQFSWWSGDISPRLGEQSSSETGATGNISDGSITILDIPDKHDTTFLTRWDAERELHRNARGEPTTWNRQVNQLVHDGLGNQFGMTVTTGIDPEGQMIQGPAGFYGPEHLICSLAARVGAGVGSLSFRDYLVMLPVNDGDFSGKMLLHFRTEQEKDELLRAWDKALARVDTLSKPADVHETAAPTPADQTVFTAEIESTLPPSASVWILRQQHIVLAIATLGIILAAVLAWIRATLNLA